MLEGPLRHPIAGRAQITAEQNTPCGESLSVEFEIKGMGRGREGKGRGRRGLEREAEACLPGGGRGREGGKERGEGSGVG